MTLAWLAAAVPSEIAGLPTWALNGLSIGSLVSFILVGLGTSRLWTKRQVDIVREDHTKAIAELTKQHDREVDNLKTQHDREVGDLKDRYERHLTRTVELLSARGDDARDREKEWRGVAAQLQEVVATLADGLEPLQAQSETMLKVVTSWQTEFRREAKR